MKKHSYPDLGKHSAEHGALIKRVSDFREQLNEGRNAFSLELMAFLKDWLVSHILKTDKKYGEYFRNSGIV